ncbi:phosphoenolpyruvate-utilizing N-terminal domain-containing protein [Metabacillus arenae]|uniref:Phosphotransferase system enzyme I N-terminal domain-containing protein n=1 Tax=Metabacillus arenae TaxID=2771434 RepID=A0A926NA69_9BACI|nr:phosphoenolpyruvate-utilizing N-terminal domain-containing protein [Metabacillus arenae]MBD1380422.1 hypothetical protein [Metabacillus arenae]
MSTVIKGIAASPGFSIARAFRLENPRLTVERTLVTDTDVEVLRFEEALTQSKLELEDIKEHARKELGDDHAEAILSMSTTEEVISVVKSHL